VKALQLFSNHSTPPIPDPTMHPNLSLFIVSTFKPASTTACFAAARAKCVYRPFRLIILPLRPLALASKLTTPASYKKNKLVLF
jgi:hypothetical protein